MACLHFPMGVVKHRPISCASPILLFLYFKRKKAPSMDQVEAMFAEGKRQVGL